MTTAVERAARLAAKLRRYGIDPGEDGIEDGSMPYWVAYLCPCCGSTQRVRQTVKRWDADPAYLKSRFEGGTISMLSLTVSSNGPRKLVNHREPLAEYLAAMPSSLARMNAQVVAEWLRRLSSRLDAAAIAALTTARQLDRF
jgi:hypothetical protein